MLGIVYTDGVHALCTYSRIEKSTVYNVFLCAGSDTPGIFSDIRTVLTAKLGSVLCIIPGSGIWCTRYSGQCPYSMYSRVRKCTIYYSCEWGMVRKYEPVNYLELV